LSNLVLWDLVGDDSGLFLGNRSWHRHKE